MIFNDTVKLRYLGFSQYTSSLSETFIRQNNPKFLEFKLLVLHLHTSTLGKVAIFLHITTHDYVVFESYYHHVKVLDRLTFFRY